MVQDPKRIGSDVGRDGIPRLQVTNPSHVQIDPLPAGRSGNGAGAELQYLYSFMSFTNGQRQNRVIQF
jgi:hypothetical protein